MNYKNTTTKNQNYENKHYKPTRLEWANSSNDFERMNFENVSVR